MEVMGPLRVFSKRDVEKAFPEMSPMNLVRWQRKGYITRLKNGWYCFNDAERTENLSWLAANLILQPSYISLQTALSWYHLIPEAVYSITSVTTLKTNRISNPLGEFVYHSMKPSAYGFGLRLTDADHSEQPGREKRKVVIASAEKALLDFFYMFSFYHDGRDMEELRFDETVLKQTMTPTFYDYLERYRNKALETRIFTLLKTYSI